MTRLLCFLMGALGVFLLCAPVWAGTGCTVFKRTGWQSNNHIGFASSKGAYRDRELCGQPGYSQNGIYAYYVPENDPAFKWVIQDGYCPGTVYADADCDGYPDNEDTCANTSTGGASGVRVTYLSGGANPGCTQDQLSPAHCSDLTKNDGESGVDCGGECGDCETGCPAGYDLETRPSPSGTQLPYCVNNSSTKDADAAGNCPGAMLKKNDDPSKCVSWKVPTFGSPEYFDSLVGEPDGGASTFTPGSDPKQDPGASPAEPTSKTTTDIVEVDNGDGTSTTTTTTTTTTTNPDGTSSVSKTTHTSTKSNSTGKELSSTSNTTYTYNAPGPGGSGDDKDGDGLPDGYSAGSGSGGSGDGTGDGDPGAGGMVKGPEIGAEVNTEIVGRFQARLTSFLDAVKQAPVFGVVDGIASGPPTSNQSIAVLDTGSYGTIALDFGDWESVFTLLGWCLVGAALVRASRLVVANK